MKNVTIESYKKRLLKVHIYIQKHLDEELDLTTLAKVATFSPYHFHRIFQGCIGESVKEHVRRLKLERAVFELISTQKTILDIALDAGFKTHESFTKAFSRMFEKMPKMIRKEGKKNLRINLTDYNADFFANLILNLKRGKEKMTKVTIQNVEPIRVAFIRYIGPYMNAGSVFGKLFVWAKKQNIDFSKALVIGISHDDPNVTPKEKLRFDACISIGDDINTEGEIGVQTIRGGEYAMYVHKGPYEKLGEIYNWLIGVWLPQSGREIDHVGCFEIYRNSPQEVAPADLITEIYVPLK